MHGVVFNELEQYIEETYSEDVWETVVEEADVDRRMFLPTKSYPDEEAIALIEAGAEAAGASVPDVLTAFGEFVAPDLLEMYSAQIDDEWDALDVIEHTEEEIHKVVRVDKEDAEPPELKAERTGDSTVHVDYASDRELCDLAKGIASGVGEHYGEPLAVSEGKCMHDGDQVCEIVVKNL